MRRFEVRKCPKCGGQMCVVADSERTTRDKVWFTLQCPNCLHTEMDWHERRNGRTY